MTSMNFCSAADELLLESIIGFDSFAGCDNVSTLSTFSGKTFKTHDKKLRYFEAFSMFGKEIRLADSLVSKLEMFICHIYSTARYCSTVRYYC